MGEITEAVIQRYNRCADISKREPKGNSYRPLCNIVAMFCAPSGCRLLIFRFGTDVFVVIFFRKLNKFKQSDWLIQPAFGEYISFSFCIPAIFAYLNILSTSIENPCNTVEHIESPDVKGRDPSNLPSQSVYTTIFFSTGNTTQYSFTPDCS